MKGVVHIEKLEEIIYFCCCDDAYTFYGTDRLWW